MLPSCFPFCLWGWREEYARQSILSLAAQEGGAALAQERKKQEGKHTKGKICHFWQAAVLPGMRRKGLGLTWLCKGGTRAQVCQEHTYSISHPQGLEGPSKAPCLAVSAAVCPHLPRTRPSAVPRLPGQDNRIFASGKETLCQCTERQSLLSPNR